MQQVWVPGAPEVETSWGGRCLFRSGPCGAGGVSEGLQSLGRKAEGHFLPPLEVTFALAAWPLLPGALLGVDRPWLSVGQ